MCIFIPPQRSVHLTGWMTPIGNASTMHDTACNAVLAGILGSSSPGQSVPESKLLLVCLNGSSHGSVRGDGYGVLVHIARCDARYKLAMLVN